MSLWDDFTSAITGVGKKIVESSPLATAAHSIGNIVGGAAKTASVVASIPGVKSAAGAVTGQLAKSTGGVLEGFKASGYTPGAGPSGIVAKAGVEMSVPRFINQVAPQTGDQARSQLLNSMTDVVTQQTQQKVNQFDPLLQTAAIAEEKVFSPLIKRPVATAALLADPNSPLYDTGKFGSGFQLSDVQDAYNRTEKVSLGVALTKSLYNPLLHITGLSDAVKGQGLDLDKVNLWNDEDLKANFVDNPLGRWMSGLTDAVVGNAAIQGTLTGGLAVLKLGAAAAGFTTTMKSFDVEALAKLDDLASSHIAGTSKTVFGADVDRLAASKDINEIIDILAPHSNNPRLANLILQTEDPSIVKDFILADKGYGPAIERLASAKRSDDLWILGDASKEIYGDFATNGIYRRYSVEQRQRIAQAFDDSIQKNPKHQEIYDAFLRDETIVGPITPEMAARGIEAGQIDSVPRVFGKNYKPAEPFIGKSQYIAARQRVSELRTASVTRDFSNVGGFTQQVIGRKNAPTYLLKMATTKMPRGIVTNSGIRPLDAIEEINAHFDDIKIFQNGTNQIKISPLESKSASDYRKEFTSQYLAAQTDSERGMVLDKLNKQLMLDVGRTYGVPLKKIEAFVDESMNNLKNYHSDLGNSYAMDPSGVRVQVDPETQRQIRNSTPLLPVSRIEEDIIAAGRSGGFKGNIQNIGQGASGAWDTAFEFGNRAFSFTQLVRPSYIGKNSLIEPLIVSTMSLGSKVLAENFVSYAKDVLSESLNKNVARFQKTGNKLSPQRKALINDFKKLNRQYSDSIEMLDNHVAEWVEHFITPNGVSPATKVAHSDVIKRELNAAERVVRGIEEGLLDAAPEYSATFTKIPSLYNLVRRTEYLKSLKNPTFGADIANAEAAISKAAGEINTLAPNLNLVNKLIADEYKALDGVIKDFGPLQQKLASKFSVTEKKVIDYKRNDTFKAVMPNGETVEVPGFRSKNHLGSGYESEIANTHTRQIELTGDKIFGQKINMFNRKGPSEVTDITSPMYFDELAYIGNQYMRGDVLVDRILSGESRDSIIANWSKTRQASSYANEFGTDTKDIISIIDNRIAYINRYFPTPEAQALLAQGEVRGAELGRLLANEPKLVPIHPLDVQYEFKSGKTKNFLESMDRLTSAAWVKLGTPENKLRYAWASTEYKQRVTEKLSMLHTQGFDVTSSVVNGVRQSAAAETVAELEKTFYSIRRPNRALFMARTVAAFPTASASGIYRYARLALKNPERFSSFLNSYYGLYNSFGVDKYGNPVDSPLNADYFVVPGTKEMGLNNGRGIMLNVRATNFAVNFAGPSWLVPIAFGAIYNAKPKSADLAQQIIDGTIGHLPGYSYKELFPYGIETNVGKQAISSITPGWYKSARKYFFGDDGSADWVNSVLSQYKYQTNLYDAGLGPKPTNKSIINAARKSYGVKAAWQFGSLVGSPAYVETRPNSIFEDLFRAKADGWVAQGKSRVEAAALAEDDVNALLRLPKGSIKSDVNKQKAFSKNIYTPNSPETVNRIWEKHADLATKLGNLDPSLVGVMTADIPLGTDPQVGIFLNDPNRTLPNGDMLNKTIKSPQQLAIELEKSRYWKAYTDLKKTYNDAAIEAKYSSYLSVPELVDSLKKYAVTLGKANTTWGVAYQKSVSGDNAITFANGLQTAVNDSSYMADYGNTQFWVHAKAFLSYRDSYAKLYADAPSGSKADVKKAWAFYLQKTINDWDPALSNIINRYFINDKLKETIVEPKKETK